MTPERTLPPFGTELQILVAEDGVRAVLLCVCGAKLADATRKGADPDAQFADGGQALAESLGWHLRDFHCDGCVITWAATATQEKREA